MEIKINSKKNFLNKLFFFVTYFKIKKLLKTEKKNEKSNLHYLNLYYQIKCQNQLKK